ncbi:helix-turn-helix domain-containing protein [Burkholderia glumae]
MVDVCFDTPHVVVLPDGRMDRKNAALYLGLSVNTLSMYAVQGKGPQFVKRGRVWYRKTDLDAWIVNGDVQQPEERAV